jgi:hypothetical protein
MDQPAATELEQLHADWLERFGEPPPIIAEPEIMRRVLRQVLDKSRATPPGAGARQVWRRSGAAGGSN